MKNQVTNGFDKMKSSELIAKSNFIIAEMSAKLANFPNPVPTLAAVQNAAEQLATAEINAEAGGKVEVSMRNDKKSELIVLLRQLGIYVNLMANGDRTIALGSGFDVAKERQPTPPITRVDTPAIASGVNAGQLKVKIKRVKGARSYVYYYTSNPAAPINEWSYAPCAKSSCNLEGLTSATRYFVKVGALGLSDQYVYSEAASYVTQ